MGVYVWFILLANYTITTGIEIIFLPPYTPELNPVEKMFNIIKQYARKNQAREREKLDSVIKEKLDFFKGEGTVKYLTNSVKECQMKLTSNRTKETCCVESSYKKRLMMIKAIKECEDKELMERSIDLSDKFLGMVERGEIRRVI